MTRLHLGCGDNILPGWINLDIYPAPRVDVSDDVTKLTSIPDHSVDLIYASCLLEHFSHRDTVDILSLWRRKLSANGVLRISVPDFSAAIEEYGSGRPLRELLGLIIGGHKDPYDKHGAIFDYPFLKDCLDKAGFADIHPYDWRKTDHADFDDYSKAYLPHMDQAGRLMSLNVEAKAPHWWDADPPWYALGDSHIWVFTQSFAHPGIFESQTPVISLDGNFMVNRLGPWLAWNLSREEEQKVLLDAVKRVSTETRIILSFGEIDCRSQVVPKAKEQGRTIDQVAQDVAIAYSKQIELIQDLGYKVSVWNAPPQTGGPCYNPTAPIRGTYKECRHAVECFNTHLKLMAKKQGFNFIDIYQHLVHGGRTQTSFFSDHIHLDPRKVWPLIEEALSCQP